MSDRDTIKATLAALRRGGVPARHAWVGMSFDGVRVDLAGLPAREWYDPAGDLYTALPLAMPLHYADATLAAFEAAGMLATSCPFYDLGVVWVCPSAAELERVRSRWQAEVDAWPWALLGLSVEDCFARGLVPGLEAAAR
jgi:hypothetical protein